MERGVPVRLLWSGIACRGSGGKSCSGIVSGLEGEKLWVLGGSGWMSRIGMRLLVFWLTSRVVVGFSEGFSVHVGELWFMGIV